MEEQTVKSILKHWADEYLRRLNEKDVSIELGEIEFFSDKRTGDSGLNDIGGLVLNKKDNVLTVGLSIPKEFADNLSEAEAEAFIIRDFFKKGAEEENINKLVLCGVAVGLGAGLPSFVTWWRTSDKTSSLLEFVVIAALVAIKVIPALRNIESQFVDVESEIKCELEDSRASYTSRAKEINYKYGEKELPFSVREELRELDKATSSKAMAR